MVLNLGCVLESPRKLERTTMGMQGKGGIQTNYNQTSAGKAQTSALGKVHMVMLVYRQN